MTKEEALSLEQTLRLALEALEVANSLVDGYYLPKEKAWLPEIEEAITAIKAALLSRSDGEAKNEPVVWNEGVPAMLPKQKEGETFIVSYEPKLEAKDEPVACVIDGDLYFHHEIDWEDLAYQGHGIELLYATPPQSFTYEQVKAHIRAASMSANDISVGSDTTEDGVSIVIRRRDELLYAEFFAYTQPQRTWVGLTDEEREQVINANTATGLWHMAKDIEAKLKEKNGYA